MSKIVVRLNQDVQPTGSDLAVVNAARRSFNSRSEWANPFRNTEDRPLLKDKDRRLIEFLARGMTADDFYNLKEWFYNQSDPEFTEELVNKIWEWRNTPTHDTPFNHCFISFEVKAPIFVARQLVKHEYLIMSEFSRRYITDEVEFYEPDYWRKAAPNKKQGSLEEDSYYNLDTGYYSECLAEFNNMVQSGVAPEQARSVLPQSVLTEWTWSGTLGAFAKMCQLRLHPDAQYEARIVAEEVYKHLLVYYPVSAKALVKGPDV